MIPEVIQNSKKNKDEKGVPPTISELYEYIDKNINNIMKDESIKEMLDPKTNSTTRIYLQSHPEIKAYVMSFLTTIMLLFEANNIRLND